MFRLTYSKQNGLFIFMHGIYLLQYTAGKYIIFWMIRGLFPMSVIHHHIPRL